MHQSIATTTPKPQGNSGEIYKSILVILPQALGTLKMLTLICLFFLLLNTRTLIVFLI